jgi:hypothetical protein
MAHYHILPPTEEGIMNNMNNSDRATRLHRALDRICDEGALSGISKGVGSAAQGAGSAVKGAGEGVGGVASGVGSAVKGAGHAIGHLLGGGEDRVPKPVALPGGAVAVTDRHRRLHAALDVVCDRMGITGDAWEESKHPRKGGKFASKGGGGGTATHHVYSSFGGKRLGSYSSEAEAHKAAAEHSRKEPVDIWTAKGGAFGQGKAIHHYNEGERK